MSRGQHRQPLPLGGQERTATDVQRAGARLDNRCEGDIEFMHRCGFHGQNSEPHGFASGLKMAAEYDPSLPVPDATGVVIGAPAADHLPG